VVHERGLEPPRENKFPLAPQASASTISPLVHVVARLRAFHFCAEKFHWRGGGAFFLANTNLSNLFGVFQNVKKSAAILFFLQKLSNFPARGTLRAMNFSEKLESAVREKNSCLMLGLDPNISKMPKFLPKTAAGAQEFCEKILDATHDLICGVKIQMAYFEQFGSAGIAAVENLLKKSRDLGLITMIDGKRNDIGATAEAYAAAYLADGPLGADCCTVNPFLGSDGVLPFVKKCEENDRGIFVLVRTSNPSALEFQGGKEEISLRVAEKIEEWNITTQSPKNMLSSVGAVIGATIEPDFLKFFRDEMPHAWFLCPGVGAQGGSLDAVKNVRVNGLGVLIPVSRSVLYASADENFVAAARDEMQKLWELQAD
jgi:orotidine-5'-phosphate decarboxylase